MRSRSEVSRLLVAFALTGAMFVGRANGQTAGTVDASLVSRVEELMKRSEAAAAGERGAILEETVKARAELIASGGNDERMGTWLLDQADAVMRIAARDGAEWSVLYGVPTAGQRARIRSGAIEAAALHERAEGVISAAIEKLETTLFESRGDEARARRVSEAIEPRLRVLVDAEQAWRSPMIDARSTILAIAATEVNEGMTDRRRRADVVANELEGMQGPDELGEASRLLMAGTARLLADQPAEAGDHFRHAAASSKEQMTVEQALLGETASARNAEGARALSRELVAGSDEKPLLLALVRAEVAAKAVLSHAPDRGAAKAAVQREALSGMAAVMRRVLREGEGVSPTVRELVAQKIAAVTDSSQPWGYLEAGAIDAPIAYARGLALLGRDRDADRVEGKKVLRGIVDGVGEDETREAAMWALGMERSSASEDRARMLLRLAVQYPKSSRASAALTEAGTLLRGEMASKRSDVLRLQRDVIHEEVQRGATGRHADELRSLALANYAIDEAAPVTAEVLDNVVNGLAKWPIDDEPHRTADERNMSIVVGRALTGAPAGDRERIARTATTWARDRGSKLAARFRLAWGEALLELNRPLESVQKIGEIGKITEAPLTNEEMVRARLALARGQRGTGDDAGAFATFRALADELDVADEESGKRLPAFWASWAEMLEILQSQNADGERTATIRLQTNRLKLIDGKLGGSPWAERIGRVEGSLK